MAGEKAAQPVKTTPRKHLFSCGVGHLGNDLVDAVLMSFGLIYYMKVAELTGAQAGVVLVSGQVATFIANPIFGYFSDRVDIPLLSRKLGRRKSWHLVGTILTSVFFVLAFTPCPWRAAGSTSFIYFLFTFNLSSFWFGAVGISHSSIVPEVAKNEEESIIVSSIVTMMAYSGCLYTYAIVWMLLKQSDEKTLGPTDWKYFTQMTTILVATGLVFMTIFQVWTVEPRRKKQRRLSTTFISAGLFAVSLMFHLGPEKDEGNTSTGRKTSKLRKVSQYVLPYDVGKMDGTSFTNGVSCTSCMEATPDQEPTAPRAETRANSGVATELATKEGQQQTELSGAREDLKSVADERKELLSVVDACHVQLETKQQHFSVRELLKQPGLYKATLVYVCGFGLEDITYSYLGLYLTDYLQFPKEAVAYFSMVFLVSAIFGTVVAKQLINLMGRTWTQLLESCVGLVGAAWLYLVTESNKHMAYGAIVMAGFCVSALMVMGRSELADFARDDKESAGFAYAFAAALQEILCAVLFLFIQQFYPSDTSSPCLQCGQYIRLVYAITIGSHALVSIVAAVACNRAGLGPFACRAANDITKHEIVFL